MPMISLILPDIGMTTVYIKEYTLNTQPVKTSVVLRSLLITKRATDAALVVAVDISSPIQTVPKIMYLRIYFQTIGLSSLLSKLFFPG